MATMPGGSTPRVFISYSWDDPDHRQWVRRLAERLRADHVDARMDELEMRPGERVPHYMEKSIRESDFVLFVCTPAYRARADGRVGGVGYEGHVITGELVTSRNEQKFIPILRRGSWGESLPTWAAGKYGLDFTAVDLRDPGAPEYQSLLANLRGEHRLPPLGHVPDEELEVEIGVRVHQSSEGHLPQLLCTFVNHTRQDVAFRAMHVRTLRYWSVPLPEYHVQWNEIAASIPIGHPLLRVEAGEGSEAVVRLKLVLPALEISGFSAFVLTDHKPLPADGMSTVEPMGLFLFLLQTWFKTSTGRTHAGPVLLVDAHPHWAIGYSWWGAPRQDLLRVQEKADAVLAALPAEVSADPDVIHRLESWASGDFSALQTGTRTVSEIRLGIRDWNGRLFSDEALEAWRDTDLLDDDEQPP